ncbi:hypothetical protein [Brevibacillus choshinensis]|uniref:Uncharacterized protein n=1 Tax=Brevibacillus choshinensis TaxID=54911 RepID=A0ABX7FPJ4_BRECH|nr:hypothetical protein [Brevibacillus choshinensis]QRG67222.1 hypothetical protein JNE38_27860 [Brevibacillus choshinensis]
MQPETTSIKENQHSLMPNVPPLLDNLLREVGICVPKVYDWLLATSWERFKLSLPVHFRPLIQAEEISVHCLDPFSPMRSTDRSCCVLAEPRKLNLLVKGNVVPSAIIRTLFQTSVALYFFAGHRLLFDYYAPIHMVTESVVCLPEPLNEKNVRCRIAAGECTPFTGFLRSGMIELELFLIQEISVETQAILEVTAKACTPRIDRIPSL